MTELSEFFQSLLDLKFYQRVICAAMKKSSYLIEVVYFKENFRSRSYQLLLTASELLLQGVDGYSSSPSEKVGTHRVVDLRSKIASLYWIRVIFSAWI